MKSDERLARIRGEVAAWQREIEHDPSALASADTSWDLADVVFLLAEIERLTVERDEARRDAVEARH